MPVNVQITGFPHVLKLAFTQTSDARAGRCVLTTTVSTDVGVASMPRHTSLTVTTPSGTATWSDMRVVKTARIGRGHLRIVLEDSRWKLWETKLNANYNERNALGAILTGQQKTISELATELSTATGLTIQTGVVPSVYVPARWAGRLAGECLRDLLWWSGCRLVYEPTSQIYHIQRAASGADLNLSNAMFRLEPQNKYQTLKVRSAPTLFEDTMDCTAKQINTTTGSTEVLGSSTLPATPIEAYGQTRFRLWEPNSVTHPEAHSNDEVLYLDHRAKSHLFDPQRRVFEKARIVRDEFERFPHHEPFTQDHGSVARAIELTGGGRAYLTDHPVLLTDATGVLLKECKLVTSYHIKDGADFVRETVDVPLDGTAGELTVDLDWVHAVNSTLSDMASPTWDDVLQEFADEMANHFKGVTRTASLPGVVTFGGSGHVGAVKYRLKTGSHPEAKTMVAINYIPGSIGDAE